MAQNRILGRQGGVRVADGTTTLFPGAKCGVRVARRVLYVEGRLHVHFLYELLTVDTLMVQSLNLQCGETEESVRLRVFPV